MLCDKLLQSLTPDSGLLRTQDCIQRPNRKRRALVWHHGDTLACAQDLGKGDTMPGSTDLLPTVPPEQPDELASSN